jgi:glycosyltransferase involved in cell wall biosynthesis
MAERTRFAVVASHPIQYYAPYYRALAGKGNLQVRAFFASRIGIDKTMDPGMGVEIEWKMDLLGGYEHEFLPGAERIKTTGPRKINNTGVGAALERFGPDIVLLHGFAQMTMLKALVWCRRKRVPAMMISDSSLHAGTGRVMRGLKSAVLPVIFRQIGAFLCIGDANARYLQAFGVPSARRFRVPNMVDEGFWAYRERRAEARAWMRAELGLDANDLAVLFVGKLMGRKRPGDLLAALKRLSEHHTTSKRVKLLFVGDGELRAGLQAAAARDRLPAHFLGFINIDKLPAYYCAADVLAHPAEIETFGVIVLEAAILGLPLVLSEKVGAIGRSSIARPGENALIHACGDVEALSGLLARLASEPETLARLGEASSRISTDHDGHVSVAGTLAAIECCVEGTASRAPIVRERA